MISDQKLDEWCETSTWTIKEAAFLINGYDPADTKVEISPSSKHPVSQTYYWLRKEEGQGKLFAVTDKKGEQSYSPGTLMRRLKKKKKGVKEKVFAAYELKSKHVGPHNQSVDAKATYRAAAEEAWKEIPNLTSQDLADVLTELPKYLQDHSLANRSTSTIRKYIKNLSPMPSGRPKTGSTADPSQVNLLKIASQISL